MSMAGVWTAMIVAGEGVAAELAAADGVAERWTCGFLVGMRRDGVRRRLVVGRVGRAPSQDEALVVAQAAGVPEESEARRGGRQIVAQDGRPVHVLTLEYTWREV